MQKTSFFLLLLFFFSHTFLFGQSVKMFSPEEMREDIDTLIKYIEDAHPNPYYRYSKEQFYKEAAIIKNKLHKPLDLVGFYLQVEPLITKLEDGHTDFRMPVSEYNKRNPFVLPYKFALSPVKPYILSVRPYRSIAGQFPDGAEIISINGIAASTIVEDVVNLNSGETKAFRAEFGGANYFDFYLETLYKAKEVYTIRYRFNKQVKTIVVKGIKRDVLNERLKRYNDSVDRVSPVPDVYYSLQLRPDNKTAIIAITEFNDLGDFKAFIDSAFTVIKNKGIENLIIDIRENGGGDSDIGDEFLQYIAKSPFKQYDKVLNKHSRLLKERLMAHRVNRKLDSADIAFMNKPNGVFDTEVYEDTPLRNNPLRFTGKLYLLTSAYTFSSAADFAQAFKYYKLGTIIGEETGGLIISYGDIVSPHLPHTQLGLTISSKLYFNVGTKENDWKGVVPDKVIPSAQAMEKALELIRQSANGNRQ